MHGNFANTVRGTANSEPRLSKDDFYRFTINLELMLASGIGITKALEVFAESQNPNLSTVAQKLNQSIASGHHLSQAMAQQPKSFSKGFCRLIQSGEVTGKIPECLNRSALTQEKNLELVRTIKKATVYPLILLVSSAVMIALMLYLVFPMMLKVTGDVGVDPPALTQLVINLASPKVFGTLALLLFMAYLTIEWELRNPAGENHFRLFLEASFPPGKLLVLTLGISSLRQLALMLETGTDLMSSLKIAREIAEQSVLLKRAYLDIEERVRAGQYLSEGFEAHPVFPKLLPAMVKVAEEAGDIHSMLYRFCDIVEDEMQSKVDTFSALLEPIMMGAMGFVVGTILLAAFLPVYQLVAI